MPFRYKAFISYSHAADGKLAPSLQSGLERFAKPWYRLRALRIFRDKTGLAVTPELWGSIQKALEASEYFILLASPAAAQSKWVCQEIEFWIQHRSVEQLLIVLTDGTIVWQPDRGDFDWTKTEALPPLLQGKFKAEPNYLDLKWARVDTDVSVRRPQFLDCIASIAATLRNVPLDDLIGEDLTHYRATRRMLRFALVTLLVLVISALYASYLANHARDLAERLDSQQAARIAQEQQAKDAQARQAEEQRLAVADRERKAEASRRLAAAAAGVLASDRSLSVLLAMEAVQISATPEAEAALREPLMKQAPAVILQGPDRLTVTQTTFSPDGQRLLAVFEDGSVRIWSTAAAGNPVVLTAQSTRYSRADGIHAAFSPDGSTILTVPFVDFRTFLEAEGKSAAARIWDARTGQLVHELKHPYVQAGAFSPDGRRVVTVGYSLPDDTVRIWDAASGAVLSKFKDDEGAVVWVDYSRDGQLFVTASRDTANTVRIRAASDGKTIATLRVPGKTFVTAAMFSPDGRWLLTANQNEPLRLWDWRGAPGSSVAELQGSAGSAGPDGAVFSPDSKLLVTWGPDDSARIWQVPSGHTLYELPLEDRITEAAFSPDGRWVVTAGLDRSAVLWDASSGKRLLDFGGSDNPRTTAAFSPDGARIATGTPSGRVLLHSCAFCGSVEQLLSFGRTQVTRTLTAEERAKYLRPVAPP